MLHLFHYFDYFDYDCLQVLKAQLGQTLALSTSSSSPSDRAVGLDSLVSEDVSFVDASLEVSEKLKHFSPHIRKWLAGEVEQQKVLDQHEPVTSHSTYGQMAAQVLMSCTCSKTSKSGEKESCSLHCSDPNLADIVFTISQAVLQVFGDGFMCYANLLADHVSAG